jgi:hypothetical protein
MQQSRQTASVPPIVRNTNQATAGGRRNTKRSRQTNIRSFVFASVRGRFTSCTWAIILRARFFFFRCLHSIRQSTQEQQCRQKCPSPIKDSGRRKGHWWHATIAWVIRVPIRPAVVYLRWLHRRLRIRGRAGSFLDAGPVLGEFGKGFWKDDDA